MASSDVSGRYRGRRHGFEVQLRVDVDGPRPCNRVSADYYRVSGRDTAYVGSMRVDAPVVTAGAAQTTITGAAAFSMPTKCKGIKVRIRRARSGAPAAASFAHLPAPGAPGTSYDCKFESASFRIVDLEEAQETGVTPAEPYDTASLPAPGNSRKLSHFEAFADAGIEMRSTGAPTIVDTSMAGDDATWSDAELHAAMEEHFSRWGDRPQWAIWLLHAASHDDPNIAGLMFDQRGLQRQGCAVFYGHDTDTSAEIFRNRLHTCVHELGHGFNLPHCWQRSLTEPPIPSRPDARSWMNYPELVPGGAETFWSDFEFGFDDPELVHLRHAFESEVIMGGKPFAGAAARDRTPGWDLENSRDPGLSLKLSAPRALTQEVPVTVGLELSSKARQGRAVPPVLGPRPGNIDIAIRRPSGGEFVFEPLLRHCRGEEMITLRAGDPPVRDQAFIHYGKGGFAFDRPGRYFVRARYAPPDGPVVLSNVAAIHVRAPVSSDDRRVAALIAGDEQVGTLMSLLGSDARALQRGNNRLKEIIGRFPTHPVADVARVIRATNLARGFKRLDSSGTVQIRPPQLDEANTLIAQVVDLPRAEQSVDRRPDRTGSLKGGRPKEQLTGKPGVDPAVNGVLGSRGQEVVFGFRGRPSVTTQTSQQTAPPDQREQAREVQQQPVTDQPQAQGEPRAAEPAPPEGA